MRSLSKIVFLIIGVFTSVVVDAQNLVFEEVLKLGSEINTNKEDMRPYVTFDGSRMYFVRENYKKNIGGEEAGSDIWYSYVKKDVGTTAKNDFVRLNNKGSNAVVGVSEDHQTLYILNKYNKSGYPDGFGISYSKRKYDDWLMPKNLKIPGLEYTSGSYDFDMHSNEKMLIISYKGKSTKGKEDLYVSLKKDGNWSSPINLGSTINSSSSDITPFLSHDTKTLYFSSDREGGLGGQDIYMSKRLDKTWTKWSKPINVGKPLNSAFYDGYFTLDDELEAHFSSNRNQISVDIYFSQGIMMSDEEYTFYLEDKKREEEDERKERMTAIQKEIDVKAEIARVEKETKEAALLVDSLGSNTSEEVIASTKEIEEEVAKVSEANIIDKPKEIETEVISSVGKPTNQMVEEAVLVEKEEIKSKTTIAKEEIVNEEVVAIIDANNTNVESDKIKEIQKEEKKSIESVVESEMVADTGEISEEVEIGKSENEKEVTEIVNGQPLHETVLEEETENVLVENDKEEASKSEEDNIEVASIIMEEEIEESSIDVVEVIEDAKNGVIVEEKEELIVSNIKEETFEKETIEEVSEKVNAMNTEELESEVENAMLTPDGTVDTDKEKSSEPIVHMKAGKVVYNPGQIVRTVYHEFDKSKPGINIDDIIDVLKKNPWMKISVESHTDSKGSEEYNLELSKKRASSCKTYLLRRGISMSRIKVKYWGELQPIAPNTLKNGKDNPAGRDKNRRTEFIVITNKPTR